MKVDRCLGVLLTARGEFNSKVSQIRMISTMSRFLTGSTIVLPFASCLRLFGLRLSIQASSRSVERSSDTPRLSRPKSGEVCATSNGWMFATR